MFSEIKQQETENLETIIRYDSKWPYNWDGIKAQTNAVISKLTNNYWTEKENILKKYAIEAGHNDFEKLLSQYISWNEANLLNEPSYILGNANPYSQRNLRDAAIDIGIVNFSQSHECAKAVNNKYLELNKKIEIRFKTLIKLNDEVQILERQFLGKPQNVHGEETLMENLSDEAYDNHVLETHIYIQNLKNEIRIKNQVEKARALESYLGIQGTRPYDEHNKDWWSDENQVNDYLNYLRAEEANKKSKEIPYIDNKDFGLQNKADSESEEERKSVDLNYQRASNVKNSTGKKMIENNHNQSNITDLIECNQNKTIKMNKQDLTNLVDGLQLCENMLVYYKQKANQYLKSNTDKENSPTKHPSHFIIQFNNITHNNNSYNILTKDIQMFDGEVVNRTDSNHVVKGKNSPLLKLKENKLPLNQIESTQSTFSNNKLEKSKNENSSYVNKILKYGVLSSTACVGLYFTYKFLLKNASSSVLSSGLTNIKPKI